MTIAELRALDPYQNQVNIYLLHLIYKIYFIKYFIFKQQDKKFTIKETITELNAQQGWFYNACPRCCKRVKQSGTSWWCDTHIYLTTMPVSW